MSDINYFNYDKKTIKKYIKEDVEELLYKNKIQIYINNILAILSDAEQNGIDSNYLLKKVKNRLIPIRKYKGNKINLKRIL